MCRRETSKQGLEYYCLLAKDDTRVYAGQLRWWGGKTTHNERQREQHGLKLPPKRHQQNEAVEQKPSTHNTTATKASQQEERQQKLPYDTLRHTKKHHGTPIDPTFAHQRSHTHTHTHIQFRGTVARTHLEAIVARLE